MTQDRTVFPFDFTVFPREQRLELERIIEFVLNRQLQRTVESEAPAQPDLPPEPSVDLGPIESRLESLERRVSILERQTLSVVTQHVSIDSSPITLGFFGPDIIHTGLVHTSGTGTRDVPVYFQGARPGILALVAMTRESAVIPTFQFFGSPLSTTIFQTVSFDEYELAAFALFVMKSDFTWSTLLASPLEV